MKTIRISDKNHAKIKEHCKLHKLKMYEFVGNACAAQIKEYIDARIDEIDIFGLPRHKIVFDGKKYCCEGSEGTHRLVYEIIEGQTLRTFDTLVLTDHEFEAAKLEYEKLFS